MLAGCELGDFPDITVFPDVRVSPDDRQYPDIADFHDVRVVPDIGKSPDLDVLPDTGVLPKASYILISGKYTEFGAHPDIVSSVSGHSPISLDSWISRNTPISI